MRTALLASVSVCLLSSATAPAASARPIDRRALTALLARAKESRSDAVVIYKDGALVGQWYFGRPEGPIEAMSATKSIVNLAIGRLIHSGKIRSLDQPVSDFFPEWRQGKKRLITIRHLLNHTSGLQNEPSNTMLEIYPSPDFVKLALAAELTADPGTAFAYNNKAVNLLAGIVKVASGKRMDLYVRDEIFAPLGITDFTWTLDTAGNPHAMSGLQIRALDFARIGELMLRGGTWNGKTIIPRSWVDESTRPGQRFNPRCGLLWWRLGHFRYRAASDELIAAWRKGGASEDFITRMLPFKGVVYADRKQLAAALERAFPAAPDQPSMRDRNTWMKGL
ncbi:MAG TPA: serine hydrolase, partial [Kofleriaceae bacterium]|nr:serine hydrolase [Kofleriaceae bacterium]